MDTLLQQRWNKKVEVLRRTMYHRLVTYTAGLTMFVGRVEALLHPCRQMFALFRRQFVDGDTVGYMSY